MRRIIVPIGILIVIWSTKFKVIKIISAYLLVVCILLTVYAQAQEGIKDQVIVKDNTDKDSLRKDSILSNALRVFIDIGNCSYCDFAYIRKEINYVNYVRDPKVSQVQVIVFDVATGSGGREFNFIFIGKNEFSGRNDTIKQATSVNNTQEENRIEIVRILKMGLMRYIMKTPGNKFVEIKSNLPSAGTEKVQDKWKSWVYNLSIYGYGNGQKSYSFFQFSSSASASKVTPEWKINFNANCSFSKNKYIYNDTTTINTYLQSYSFTQNTIKSLSKHWSVGYFYTIYNSTYSNIDLCNDLKAGIEYNVFPYEKSASKLITFHYKIGCSYFQYYDTTIYNKTKEFLLSHSLGMGMNFILKWGSATSAIVYSNYLQDFSKNNLYLNTNINVRIFKGLSVSAYIYLSLIHDQLALSKSGATLDEVLLQQQQLATQYSYFFNFGITYTFGSIYNNVVNPRFDY